MPTFSIASRPHRNHQPARIPTVTPTSDEHFARRFQGNSSAGSVRNSPVFVRHPPSRAQRQSATVLPWDSLSPLRQEKIPHSAMPPLKESELSPALQDQLNQFTASFLSPLASYLSSPHQKQKELYFASMLEKVWFAHFPQMSQEFIDELCKAYLQQADKHHCAIPSHPDNDDHLQMWRALFQLISQKIARETWLMVKLLNNPQLVRHPQLSRHFSPPLKYVPDSQRAAPLKMQHTAELVMAEMDRLAQNRDQLAAGTSKNTHGDLRDYLLEEVCLDLREGVYCLEKLTLDKVKTPQDFSHYLLQSTSPALHDWPGTLKPSQPSDATPLKLNRPRNWGLFFLYAGGELPRVNCKSETAAPINEPISAIRSGSPTSSMQSALDYLRSGAAAMWSALPDLPVFPPLAGATETNPQSAIEHPVEHPVEHSRLRRSPPSGALCEMPLAKIEKKNQPVDGLARFDTITESASKAAQFNHLPGLKSLTHADAQTALKLAFGPLLKKNEYVKSFITLPDDTLEFRIGSKGGRYKRSRKLAVGLDGKTQLIENLHQDAPKWLGRVQGINRGGNYLMGVYGVITGAIKTPQDFGDYLGLAADSAQVLEDSLRIVKHVGTWMGKHLPSAKLTSFLAPASGLIKSTAAAIGKASVLLAPVSIAYSAKQIYDLSQRLNTETLTEAERATTITQLTLASTNLALNTAAIATSVAGYLAATNVIGFVILGAAALGLGVEYLVKSIMESSAEGVETAEKLVAQLDEYKKSPLTLIHAAGNTSYYVTSNRVPIERITPDEQAIVTRLDKSGIRATHIKGKTSRRLCTQRKSPKELREIIPFFEIARVDREIKSNLTNANAHVFFVNLLAEIDTEWTDTSTPFFQWRQDAPLLTLDRQYSHPYFENRYGNHHISNAYIDYQNRTQTLDYTDHITYVIPPIREEMAGKISLQINLDTSPAHVSTLVLTPDVPLQINSLHSGNLQIYLNDHVAQENVTTSNYAGEFLFIELQENTFTAIRKKFSESVTKEPRYVIRADSVSKDVEVAFLHNDLLHSLKWSQEKKEWTKQTIVWTRNDAPSSMREVPGYTTLKKVDFPLPAGDLLTKTDDHSLWIYTETGLLPLSEKKLSSYHLLQKRSQDIVKLEQALHALLEKNTEMVLFDPSKEDGPLIDLTPNGLISQVLAYPMSDPYSQMLATHAAQGKFFLRLVLPALIDIDPLKNKEGLRVTFNETDIRQWMEPLVKIKQELLQFVTQAEIVDENLHSRLTEDGKKELFKITRPEGLNKISKQEVDAIVEDIAHVSEVVEIPWRDHLGDHYSFYLSTTKELIHAPFDHGAPLKYLHAYQGQHYFTREGHPETLLRLSAITADMESAEIDNMVHGDLSKMLASANGKFTVDATQGPVWHDDQDNEMRPLPAMSSPPLQGNFWQLRKEHGTEFWEATQGRQASADEIPLLTACLGKMDLEQARAQISSARTGSTLLKPFEKTEQSAAPLSWHSPFHEALGEVNDKQRIIKTYAPDANDVPLLDHTLDAIIDVYDQLSRNPQVKIGNTLIRLENKVATKVGMEFDHYDEMLQAIHRYSSATPHEKLAFLSNLPRAAVLKFSSKESGKPVFWLPTEKSAAQSTKIIQTSAAFAYLGMQEGHFLFYDQKNSGVIKSYQTSSLSSFKVEALTGNAGQHQMESDSISWINLSPQNLAQLGMADAVALGDGLSTPAGMGVRRVADSATSQPTTLLELTSIIDEEAYAYYLDEVSGRLSELRAPYDDGTLTCLGKTAAGEYRLLHPASQDIVRLTEQGPKIERSGFDCAPAGSNPSFVARDSGNYLTVMDSTRVQGQWENVVVPAEFSGTLSLEFSPNGSGELHIENLPAWTALPVEKNAQGLRLRKQSGGEIHLHWKEGCTLLLNQEEFSDLTTLSHWLSASSNKVLSNIQRPIKLYGNYHSGTTRHIPWLGGHPRGGNLAMGFVVRKQFFWDETAGHLLLNSERGLGTEEAAINADRATIAQLEPLRYERRILGTLSALWSAIDPGSSRNWLTFDLSRPGNTVEICRMDEVDAYRVLLGNNATLTIPSTFLDIRNDREVASTDIIVDLHALRQGETASIELRPEQWALSLPHPIEDESGRTIIACKEYGQYKSSDWNAAEGVRTDHDARLILTPPANQALSIKLEKQGLASFLKIQVLPKEMLPSGLRFKRTLPNQSPACINLPSPQLERNRPPDAPDAGVAITPEVVTHYTPLVQTILDNPALANFKVIENLKKIPKQNVRAEAFLRTMSNTPAMSNEQNLINIVKKHHHDIYRGVLGQQLSGKQNKLFDIEVLSALDEINKKDIQPIKNILQRQRKVNFDKVLSTLNDIKNPDNTKAVETGQIKTRNSMVGGNYLTAALTRPDGKQKKYVSVSGDQKVDVMIGEVHYLGKEIMPNAQNAKIFTLTTSDGNPRNGDTEAKLMVQIEKEMKNSGPNDQFELDIFSTKDSCPSCTLAMTSFNQLYPNLKINLWFKRR
ncbi:deaminase domain-containing protein [Herbaspirillum sp. RTI4]|uniref:deaminase domain-containing protein n=1 Tax=Herbaspirillum sp. RTI4 TaxID=3048640 RepID=UPI002AB330D4|nr:deaminase domain-containing protein [Herbaspirillum sp. RTI4]MDY7579081.1 deaminase domain-containing protein [Herbaspirillum sp. RTI4]MEA9981340.1 deaminase domain-containing protein [Herbaspirillum sp. RTI4]